MLLKGNLNKKVEYGAKKLHRLVTEKNGWEDEKQRQREVNLKANLISDMVAFVSVYKNVVNKCKESMHLEENLSPEFCRYKNKRLLEEEEKMVESTADGHGVKRTKVQETSTPILSMKYREREEIFVDLTPIKRSPIFDLNGTVDAINVSSEPSQNITLEHTGMSPVLKKMLITPVKEDEIMEMKVECNRSTELNMMLACKFDHNIFQFPSKISNIT